MGRFIYHFEIPNSFDFQIHTNLKMLIVPHQVFLHKSALTFCRILLYYSLSYMVHRVDIHKLEDIFKISFFDSSLQSLTFKRVIDCMLNLIHINLRGSEQSIERKHELENVFSSSSQFLPQIGLKSKKQTFCAHFGFFVAGVFAKIGRIATKIKNTIFLNIFNELHYRCSGFISYIVSFVDKFNQTTLIVRFYWLLS